jgi:hypothetical protein
MDGRSSTQQNKTRKKRRWNQHEKTHPYMYLRVRPSRCNCHEGSGTKKPPVHNMHVHVDYMYMDTYMYIFMVPPEGAIGGSCLFSALLSAHRPAVSNASRSFSCYRLIRPSHQCYVHGSLSQKIRRHAPSTPPLHPLPLSEAASLTPMSHLKLPRALVSSTVSLLLVLVASRPASSLVLSPTRLSLMTLQSIPPLAWCSLAPRGGRTHSCVHRPGSSGPSC